MWLVEQPYIKLSLKVGRFQKVSIIHNNDVTPENEPKSVHKIDNYIKIWVNSVDILELHFG